jgi:hypothetical protein
LVSFSCIFLWLFHQFYELCRGDASGWHHLAFLTFIGLAFIAFLMLKIGPEALMLFAFALAASFLIYMVAFLGPETGNPESTASNLRLLPMVLAFAILVIAYASYEVGQNAGPLLPGYVLSRDRVDYLVVRIYGDNVVAARYRSLTDLQGRKDATRRRKILALDGSLRVLRIGRDENMFMERLPIGTIIQPKP